MAILFLPAIALVLLELPTAHSATATRAVLTSRGPRASVTVRYTHKYVPGEDSVFVDGGGWFTNTNCTNKVTIKIKDSSGHSEKAGELSVQTPLLWDVPYPKVISGELKVPNGLKAGNARLIATQDWRFNFGFGCIELFNNNASTAITLLGAAGNDPPVISEFSSPDIRQATAGAITWNASEACATTLLLERVISNSNLVELARLLDGASMPNGGNQVPFDATLNGQPLPIGEYRVFIQCTDPDGSTSAPRTDHFTVTYG